MIKLSWLILCVIPLTLSARPAPSYYKFERLHLNADGYRLLLTEHIFETRPIYYTVKILDGETVVTNFAQCTDSVVNTTESTREELVCINDSERVEISIEYQSPRRAQARWLNLNGDVEFSRSE